MSTLIHRNLALLERLHRARPGARRTILKNADADFLNALCEIALNILRGKIPLTAKQYALLKKRKEHVRLIADKRINFTRKKKIINQRGHGFILPLLGAALPFITSLFSRG